MSLSLILRSRRSQCSSYSYRIRWTLFENLILDAFFLTNTGRISALSSHIELKTLLIELGKIFSLNAFAKCRLLDHHHFLLLRR